MSTTKLLLTKEEVCELLGISRATVDRMEQRGELPSRRKLGRSARWITAEIEEAIQKLPQAIPESPEIPTELV